MKPTTKQIGDIGEKAAEIFLENQGWRILSNNFKANGGEIDLIGYKRGTLCYFEVKTRSNDNFGTPFEAVDSSKIYRIKKAATVFLKLYSNRNKIPVYYFFGKRIYRTIKNTRIDVIEVYLTPDKRVEKINHIENLGELL